MRTKGWTDGAVKECERTVLLVLLLVLACGLLDGLTNFLCGLSCRHPRQLHLDLVVVVVVVVVIMVVVVGSGGGCFWWWFFVLAVIDNSCG